MFFLCSQYHFVRISSDVIKSEKKIEHKNELNGFNWIKICGYFVKFEY